MKESVIIQRIIAIVLIVLGLAGLAAGRLGETVWAPATERSASVALQDPGAAVLIDPGVLYVGGNEGTVRIQGASDVSLITAANEDITAYLGDAKHTRITGVPDWQTLSTEVVNAEGPTTIENPTQSDLWRSVETGPSPATIDIAAFHAEETQTSPQPYRAILVVTDGTAPGADAVTITWPVDARNAWVPYAYAAGATLAIIGLLLLVVGLGSGRRRREEHVERAHAAPVVPSGSHAAGAQAEAGLVPAAGAGATGLAATGAMGTGALDAPAPGYLDPTDPEGESAPAAVDAEHDLSGEGYLEPQADPFGETTTEGAPAAPLRGGYDGFGDETLPIALDDPQPEVAQDPLETEAFDQGDLYPTEGFEQADLYPTEDFDQDDLHPGGKMLEPGGAEPSELVPDAEPHPRGTEPATEILELDPEQNEEQNR